MKISVVSGKGGTGKTTVSVNIALLLENAVIVDCDVEEPNCSIFLKPKIEKTYDVSVMVPSVDKTKCDYCGKCAEVCAYRAINVFKSAKGGNILFLDHLCHNCKACGYFCPKNAIKFIEKKIGVIEEGWSGKLKYFGGKIEIGEIKTPFLINELKSRVEGYDTIIFDGPPGASCSVMATVRGSDYCVLVTEPTRFGLNDLEIAFEVVRKFGIPSGVVINRWRENFDFEKRLKGMGLEIIGKIPYDREIAENYSKGNTIVNIEKYKNIFREIFEKIQVYTGKVK
mgnify:CR=1 FL=1